MPQHAWPLSRRSRWVSRRPRRKLLLAVMLSTAGVVACSTAPRRPAPIYEHDDPAPVGFSNAVRIVTLDQRSFEERSAEVLRRVQGASGGRPINVLALSGGGAGAAFGAGALVGWTQAGTRPEFQLVTGVSAGALTAPFAFLGPDWDAQLTKSFSGRESEHLLRFHWPGLFFGSSLFRGKPLSDLVNEYATEDMMRAIASEAGKGRMLLVATTDLDNERTVIWDMGLIAMTGGDRALKLFRQVLIASASVPGIFPPVMIPVETSGTIAEEMHVDGSTTASVFIAPEIASVLPTELHAFRGTNIYVLANGQYGASTVTTPLRTAAIVKRGLEASLHNSTRAAVLAALALAQQNGMSFQVTAIPDDYTYNGVFDLKPERMRALFNFAMGCAKNGALWTSAEGLLKRSAQAKLSRPGAPPKCPNPG